jgi:hypothetical protein
MHVRVRHRKNCILPVGLVQGDEVEVVRLDGFAVIVRDEEGYDYPVCIENLVPPNFVFINGRWVRVEETAGQG